MEILHQKGIVPTFAIPANVINKHSEPIKNIAHNGVEFAIHGYNHIDLTELTHEELLDQIEKAINIFQEKNIPFSGFRFPYLKSNAKCVELLGNSPLKWDSSYTILWDAIPNLRFRKRNLLNFQNMLNQYNCKSSTEYIALPRFYNNILEIPVSLPDDDLLTDRLGIKDEKILAQTWNEILIQTYSRGELFTLQLHPERIPLYKEILRNLIETIDNSYPKVWLTSLSSIAEWWNEKEGFWMDICKKGIDEYAIRVHGSKRATVLVKTNENGNFFNEYSVIDKNSFTIRSSKRPTIGISKNSSPNLIKFLKNEGFVFEIPGDENNHSIFLNDLEVFNEDDEIKVLQKIDHTPSPVVRFWRWPNGCRSAVAITGDIDSLTSTDFFLRAFAH
jgi:peptidoglycan/xylan/chitin deacetylase (PgdA/CDA1 family)